MADDTESVEFELDVRDNASPKLTKLEKNIGKVGGAVDRASSNFMGMIKQSAMFAGFFALGPAIAGAKNYIHHLDKISDLTGLAADRVGGISNALTGAGVSAEGVDSVFSRLVKKGAQVAEGNKSLIKLGRQYGITIKEGPEEALLGVSKLLEKGKIGAGGLQRILGVSSDDAADLTEALGQGPEALKKKFDDLTKKNAAFSEEAMAGMQEYQNASSRIGTAWNRMTAGIMIKLAPALTKLAEKFEGSIDGWAAGAEKFGKFLVEHMEKIVALAKTYAKLMVINTVSQKLTGKGVVGLAGGAFSAVSKRMAVRSAAGAGAGPLASIASFLTPFLKGLTSFRPIISGLLKLTPIGGVILVVVAAVKALASNFHGITTKLKATFGSIFATIGRIGSKISDLFSDDSPLGLLLEHTGLALMRIVDGVGTVIGLILSMVEKIIDLIPDLFAEDPRIQMMKNKKEADQYRKEGMARASAIAPGQKSYGKTRAELERAVEKRYKELLAGDKGYGLHGGGQFSTALPETKKKLEAKKEGETNMNFPNARFDIKQAFAEGYDPDRIATAFTNEIASLGERKLQSGFSPLFTVR